MTVARPGSTTGERGFSLIEVMLATVLLLVGFISLAAVFAHGMKLNLTAFDQSSATAIAAQNIEDYERLGFAYVAANQATLNGSTGSVLDDQSVKYRITRAVTLYDVAGNSTADPNVAVRAEVQVAVQPEGKSGAAVTLAKHLSKS